VSAHRIRPARQTPMVVASMSSLFGGRRRAVTEFRVPDLAAGMADPAPAFLALVAALATSGSDTVASETGKAWGRTTVLVTSFRRVPRGTAGAISLQGTLAGAVSAAAIAATGAWLGLVPMAAVPVITVAAIVASLLEGVLGATLEARGMLTNDAVNLVNSAMGAALAMWLWTIV